MEASISIKDSEQKAVLDMQLQAASLNVVNQSTFEQAASMATEIARLKKHIEAELEPGIKQAFQLHKTLKAKLNEYIMPLDTAMMTLKNKIGIYQRQVLEAQQAEQRRIQAAAEAEARKLKEEAEAAAKEAEAAGDVEAWAAATDIAQEAEALAVVAPVRVAAPKAEGVSFRSCYKGEVVDLQILISAIAEGRAPIMFIMANTSAVDQYAKATKGAMPVDGVRFYDAGSVAVKT